MKKLYTLTALFLAVCLLASCSPVKNVRTTYGEMNFLGLEWMMTPEEVFRAIGKNESDFQKGENGALGDIWYEVYYTADGLLFGKLAKVQFVFCPSADPEGAAALGGFRHDAGSVGGCVPLCMRRAGQRMEKAGGNCNNGVKIKAHFVHGLRQ